MPMAATEAMRWQVPAAVALAAPAMAVTDPALLKAVTAGLRARPEMADRALPPETIFGMSFFGSSLISNVNSTVLQSSQSSGELPGSAEMGANGEATN